MPGPHDSLNRPRRELLDQVVRRGERLRLQRRSFLAMAAASVVLLAIALPLALTAGSGENVQTVGAPVTTTTRARPRVRVYHQPTSTTKPESAPAKPGERRKPTPNPTVASKSASKPAAPAPTAKPGSPATTAKPAPAASPVPQGSEQTAACTGTQPLATTGRGRMAFVRGGQIYTSEPDGTQEKRLSPEGEALDADPAWSPSGKRLVFVRAGTVYVMDATTGAVEFPLTDPGAGAASDPAWSPDGKKIAFARGGDIWVVNAEPSSIPRAVTNKAGNESSPTWSPTSCKIAFAAADGAIYTILDSGKEEQKIIDGSSPSWSLSGTLAFELGGEVWVYTPNGPMPRARGGKPSWSAGSGELAFENQEAIYRVKNVDNEPPYPEYISGTNPAW